MPTTTIAPIKSQDSICNNEASRSNGREPTNKIAFEGHMSNISVTYPTQSLRFLEGLELDDKTTGKTTHGLTVPESASLKLKVVVVGAGIGGLACAVALARRGHSVRILEQAPKLAAVGAGIHIPPNSGRLLHRWGVFEHLEKWAAQPESINIRRWEDGRMIGRTALDAMFQKDFKSPYYVVHRAHYYEALHQRALQLGVVLELGCRVVQYRENQGSVVLSDGSVIEGDLVVAADGINSTARYCVNPNAPNEPSFGGFAAYRATVDGAKMRHDPDIAWILEKPSLNLWVGQDRHVMAYAIAAGESLNMTWSYMDVSDPSTWPEKATKEHIQEEFRGWDPQLTKVISHIDGCMKWPLTVARPLKSWLSVSSRLVVMGDAAHAMLPYMSQGAAMAVEDGAALATVLNKISSYDDMILALSSWEKERMKRSGEMQSASAVNGMILGLPDGPKQRARDASMAAEVAGEHFNNSPNQWSDPVTQWWSYGYDAEDSMEQAWARDVAEDVAPAPS